MFLISASSAVHAQTVRVTFEPSPTSPPIVDDRPSLTDWVANVHGASLMEGRLELRIHANSQFLGSVLTDELVLTGVDQKIRILLPALNWSIGVDEVVVHLNLITKNGVLQLPPQRLRTSMPTSRKFPLLIGETKQRPRSTLGRDKLSDRLRFESLLPMELKEQAITVMSQMIADDFPQDPLAFCHYEAVVLADDVFAALRSSQLDALLKWIRAGGSLYLEPGGILEAGHWEFLNGLAADDSRQIVFVADDKGRIPQNLFAAHEPFLHLSPGLGRAVLGLPEDDAAVPVAQWRSAAATLWKVRDTYRRPIVEQQWPPEFALNLQQNRNNGFGVSLAGPPLADVTRQMVDWLRPQGVRMVPLWVIALLLTILVVLIGPVDYLVLGWLKRRKWTWITFPVCVLAMSGLTVAITNAYLSSAEARRSFVVYDVADDGAIVRTNRFELVFTSATRRLISDVQSALFTPLLTGGQMDPRYYGRAAYQQQVVYVPGPDGQLVPTVQTVSGFGGEITASDPAAVQGRVPSRYRVIQDIRQWTPQLNRRFSIGPDADSPGIDWAKLQIPSAADPATIQQHDFLPRIRAQFGSQAHAMVFTSTGVVWSSQAYPYQTNDVQYSPVGPYGVSQVQGLSGVMPALQRFTAAPLQGLALVTSHTSPHGGRSLDDLPLTVSGATDRWWLVISIPQGDDIVVFRRSFRYATDPSRAMLSPEKL